MARRWWTLVGSVLSLVPPLLGQQASGAGQPRWAHVTYLTLSSAYVDAGTADGLIAGTRLTVRRGDSTVAVLQARYVATHKAACQIVRTTVPLAVGDSALFVPAAPRRDSTAMAQGTPLPTPATRGRTGAGALRGRLGLYYLNVQQLDGTGAAFAQPSGELRVTGSGLGGTGLGLTADVRSRRVTQTRADGLGTDVQNQTRVYQAAVAWQSPGSPLRVAIGRQFAPDMPSVGLVDGASVRLGLHNWTTGVFAGTQPDPVSLGVSRTTTQVGASLERHSPIGAARTWSVTGGLSASTDHGAANREFLYLQGAYATRRMSLYAAQEIDYYGPSRRVAGERAISPTSTFASVRFRLTDRLNVSAGLDNRRNVRLYRDVVNPEIAFDDAYRRGVWAGVSTRLGAHGRASFDVHTNRGGASGAADAYTLLLGASPASALGLTLRSRSTRYTAVGRAGWLESLSLGVTPWGLGDVQLAGGWRLERDRRAATTTSLRWVSMDLDVGLARAWYLLLSSYREWGGLEAHLLVYGGLSYRF